MRELRDSEKVLRAEGAASAKVLKVKGCIEEILRLGHRKQWVEPAEVGTQVQSWSGKTRTTWHS